MPEILSPFVFWAQTEKELTLKIELKIVDEPKVTLENRSIRFLGRGSGASGIHDYGFNLNFYSDINTEECEWRYSGGNAIQVRIQKLNPGWWSRLTASPQKPAWLKVDFDRWTSNGSADESEPRDVHHDYPWAEAHVEREELGYIRQSRNLVYMALYNLCVWIGWAWVLTVLCLRYMREGPESMSNAYLTVGGVIHALRFLQFLEILHILVGYTRGPLILVLSQAIGRTFTLFVLIDAEPRMQTKPLVWWLFVLWGLCETSRYPYYLARVLQIRAPILTWLRYSAWIPLSPLIAVCEGVAALRNIPYFEETGKFSIPLPNSWNFSFHFPSMLRLYLLVVLCPVTCVLMTHLNNTRRLHLYAKIQKKED